MNVLFLGGDLRYKKIMDYLSDRFDIYTVGYKKAKLDYNDVDIDKINIGFFNIIFLPMSGINNNYIIKSLDGDIYFDKIKHISKNTLLFTGKNSSILNDVNCKKYFFLEDDYINRFNNEITVSGIISKIKNKKNDTITILGYGNIGSLLSNYLKDSNLYLFDNDKKKIDDYHLLNSDNKEIFKLAIKNSDIVINTVPSNIIDPNIIKENENTFFLDIASYPHGVNNEYVKEYKNYELYLGIPGKVNVDKSGSVLLKKVKGDIGGLI